MYATFKVLVQYAIQSQFTYVQASSMGEALRFAAKRAEVAIHNVLPIAQCDAGHWFDISAL